MTTTTKTTIAPTKTTKTAKTTGPKISKATGKPVKKRATAARKAAGAARALAMKKAGKGIFAPKSLSESLAAICGGKKTLPRTEVTKGIWAYIKKNKLCHAKLAPTRASSPEKRNCMKLSNLVRDAALKKAPGAQLLDGLVTNPWKS